MGGFNSSLDLEDWFGYSVTAIGDLNGDGIEDIAVGAIKDDDGGFNRGAVYILFLDAHANVDSFQKISNTSGGFDGVLDDWDIFGTSIGYLGDMNNDGFVEIGVGAEYDGDGGWWHGAVWILSLNPDGTVHSYSKISDLEGEFDAPLGDEDVFGTDIELLGDLNGDGFKDIAVSARRDPDGGSDRGAVYILFLDNDFKVIDYQKISDTEGNFQGDLQGGDYFGGAVANIGDLNNDGIIDLAVGAYRDDDGGLNRGAVYILFMNNDGTVADHRKISDLEGSFEAEFNDDMFFGKSITFTGDLNEDGLTEIVVGARGYDNQEGPNFGAFYVLNITQEGSVDSYVQYTEGLHNFNGDINVGDSFAFSLTKLRTAGGNNAFAVGAFSDDEGGFEKGSVWILQLGKILSIESIEERNELVRIYPNPSRTSFSIEGIDNIVRVEIFDSYGKKVIAFDHFFKNTYDVTYLSTGQYLGKIEKADGSSYAFKLIKE